MDENHVYSQCFFNGTRDFSFEISSQDYLIYVCKLLENIARIFNLNIKGNEHVSATVTKEGFLAGGMIHIIRCIN